MPRQRISAEDKERLVSCYQRHGDYFILAYALEINRRTAYSIIRRYLRDGVIERRRGGPNHQIVDEQIRDAVVTIFEDHSEFTVQQINEVTKEASEQAARVQQHCVKYSMLHCRLITLKLTRDLSGQRNSPKV